MTHDLVYKGMNGFNQVGHLFYNVCVLLDVLPRRMNLMMGDLGWIGWN